MGIFEGLSEQHVTGNKPPGGGKKGGGGSIFQGMPVHTPLPAPGTTYSSPAPSSGGGRSFSPPSTDRITERITQALTPLIGGAEPASTSGYFDPNAVSEAQSVLNEAREEREETRETHSTWPYAVGATGENPPSKYSPAAKQPQPQAAGSLTQEEKITAARKVLGSAQRAERVRALRGEKRPDTPGKRSRGVPKVEEMSWEEYSALGDRERAAVDFNTMLVSATRRDGKMQERYGERYDDQRLEKNYDKTVTKMFGADGGSVDYAPETVALLQQIGFQDKSADLDDFLGLRAAITAKDIKNLSALSNVPGPMQAEVEQDLNPVELNRLELTKDLANSTLEMTQALTRGNEMLDSFKHTAFAARQDFLTSIGGSLQDPKWMQDAGLGYGPDRFVPGTNEPDDLNTYFKVSFEALANKNNDGKHQEILGAMADVLSPSEQQAFQNYVDARSRNAATYGIDLLDVKGEKYRPPEQFRAMLGLDKGGQ